MLCLVTLTVNGSRIPTEKQLKVPDITKRPDFKRQGKQIASKVAVEVLLFGKKAHQSLFTPLSAVVGLLEGLGIGFQNLTVLLYNLQAWTNPPYPALLSNP